MESPFIEHTVVSSFSMAISAMISEIQCQWGGINKSGGGSSAIPRRPDGCRVPETASSTASHCPRPSVGRARLWYQSPCRAPHPSGDLHSHEGLLYAHVAGEVGRLPDEVVVVVAVLGLGEGVEVGLGWAVGWRIEGWMGVGELVGVPELQ